MMTELNKKFIADTKTVGDLIRVAVNELEACEQSPEYEINMDRWYSKEGGTCAVCFAGSVIAQRLIPDGACWTQVLPNDFPPAVSKRLSALDCFRTGKLYQGLSRLGALEVLIFPNLPSMQRVARYCEDPAEFKTAMLCFAEYLDNKKFIIKD